MEVMRIDQSRSTTLMLKGRKRFILANSSQCLKLKIHGPRSHPHAAQSSLNYIPDDVMVNEIVLQPNDALILPAAWFHTSIGLTHSHAHCATFNAEPKDVPGKSKQEIVQCGDFTDPDAWNLSW